jgi:hypothetical protein
MKIASILLLLVALCLIIGTIEAKPVEGLTSLDDGSVTMTSHWTLTYGWTIDKSVSPDTLNLVRGDSGTSHYTIAVTKDSGTEAAWVDGNICVSNTGSNPTEGLTITADVLYNPGGGFATIASGSVDVSAMASIAAGQSHCYPYHVDIPLSGGHPHGGATYKVTGHISITNHNGHAGVAWGPDPSATASFVGSPTLILDSIHVDDTNGDSWLFTTSGSIGYGKTFTCDTDAGENDNIATIRETGQFDDATVTVNCYAPVESCTYTPGYWKTHTGYGAAPYDDTWAMVDQGADTPFFDSSQSYYEVLWTEPAGNAYYILAHAYIAAELNERNGSDFTDAQSAFDTATDIFEEYEPMDIAGLPGNSKLRSQFIDLGVTLDDYNNGIIGPGHCGE